MVSGGNGFIKLFPPPSDVSNSSKQLPFSDVDSGSGISQLRTSFFGELRATGDDDEAASSVRRWRLSVVKASPCSETSGRNSSNDSSHGRRRDTAAEHPGGPDVSGALHRRPTTATPEALVSFSARRSEQQRRVGGRRSLQQIAPASNLLRDAAANERRTPASMASAERNSRPLPPSSEHHRRRWSSDGMSPLFFRQFMAVAMKLDHGR
nr:hypothetical protein Iba_chr04bCG14830 [Ipomoea batatas]